MAVEFDEMCIELPKAVMCLRRLGLELQTINELDILLLASVKGTSNVDVGCSR
jgi:hypothetical protein